MAALVPIEQPNKVLQDQQPKPDIAKAIQEATNAFRKGNGTILPGTGGLEIYKMRNGQLFFGIHKDKQNELDFKEVRTQIFQSLDLSPDMKITQVVGDSQPFSQKATEYARGFLEKDVLSSENNMILWGYTGREADAGDRSDANHMITRYLEKNPDSRKRVLANVVNYHSVQAINNWGCKIYLDNLNFYLVYGDEDTREKGACFGDDVISSDCLAESFICIEGGGQSFRQIVNAISRGIPVKGIYNLRGYDDRTFDGVRHFSAAEFFAFLQGKLSDKKDATQKDIEKWKEEYWKTYELYDQKNDDADTKPALFIAGWKQFIAEKLWTRLDQCSFEKFKPIRPIIEGEEKKLISKL